MRRLRALLALFLGLLAIGFTAEGLLRVAFFVVLSPPQRDAYEHLRAVTYRVQHYWMENRPASAFLPPFQTFANQDFEREGRLEKIAAVTRLPPSSTWVSYDFLQPREWAGKTSYTIHTNQLGFRGKEAKKEKAKGVFRVIVLGSYQAFGHGVADDQAYPAQLEEELNRRAASPRRRFEVWNGGRHAATAIVALARLQKEIFEYQPDQLVIDYGMVDGALLDDNFFPFSMQLPSRGWQRILGALLYPLEPLLARSYLATQLHRALTHRARPLEIIRFHEALSRISEICASRHIPVIYVRQLPAEYVPEEVYRSVLKPGDDFLDVGELLRTHPGPALRFRDLKPGESWLTELHSPACLLEPEYRFANYMLDLFQLNPAGQRLVAQGLAQLILQNSRTRERIPPREVPTEEWLPLRRQ